VRFSFNIPNFGPFADPRLFADLATTVENAGWDGLLTWDALIGERWRRMETADPWILLTAAGLATSRIRLGTAVTPLARRRVRKLAKEITTLDRMTGGRMVLGVGVGDPIDDEFARPAPKDHSGGCCPFTRRSLGNFHVADWGVSLRRLTTLGTHSTYQLPGRVRLPVAAA